MSKIVKLSDGREIKIDLLKISLRKFRWLTSNQDQDAEDKFLAEYFGMTLDDYLDLPHEDWRRMVNEFFRTAREPLADPNSASASTSP